MLEAAVHQQEKVLNLQRADSELTVATVDTFLSETSVSTDTGVGVAGGGGGGGEANNKTNNNAQQLLQRGFLVQFYHKNIGTIILIGTRYYETFLNKWLHGNVQKLWESFLFCGIFSSSLYVGRLHIQMKAFKALYKFIPYHDM